MGRLIEADEVNEAIYKSFEDIQFYDGTGYDIYSDAKEIIDKIPTVEAIPKADYEARLKADLKAILVELQLEIEEIEVAKENTEIRAGECCMKGACIDLIQQKINVLDGFNNSNKN